MKREEQIKRHNKNLKDAFKAAQEGEVINLTALMGGRDEVICDDIDGREDRECYSDNWRVKEDK